MDEVVEFVLLPEVREHDQHVLQLLVFTDGPVLLEVPHLLVDLVKLLLKSDGNREPLWDHFLDAQVERHQFDGASLTSSQVS